jgi:hypothetical protein
VAGVDLLVVGHDAKALAGPRRLQLVSLTGRLQESFLQPGSASQNMLSALRRVWNNYLASIPKSAAVDSIPPSQWDAQENLPGVSKVKQKAFHELLCAVYAHLPAGTSDSLVAAGAKHLTRGDDIDAALCEALVGGGDGNDESGDEHRLPRGFIACDWKGSADVKWQADRLLRAHRLTENWTAPKRDLADVLEDLGLWLRTRQLHLFSFSTGDNVVAFAVQETQSPSVRSNLNKLKIRFLVAGEA